MKEYKEYMDQIQASDTLHRRLVELEEPAKRPIPWKRYGSMAAALALVCGLGGYGAWAAGVNSRSAPLPSYPPGHQGVPEIGTVGEPDIAVVEPGDAAEPGERTLGGYDVTGGGVTTHYVLPYIEYGDTYGAAETVMDWDIPAGAVKRELPRDEIAALMGGEDALSTHLNWDGWELSGWAAWYQDGTLWGVYLNGVEAEYGTDTFQFAVTRGHLPPTCIVYANSVTQEIRGISVTADKYDWELGGESMNAPERRVSFLDGNYGYRFEVRTADTALAEEMVSRLVCRIADQGLPLTDTEHYAMMRAGPCSVCGGEIAAGTNHFHIGAGAEGSYTCPDCGRTFMGDDWRAHVHSFTGAGEPSRSDSGEISIPEFVPDYDPAYEDGVPEQDTPAYDIREAADPSYNAPAGDICPECGAEVPAGMAHDHTCESEPYHVCEVCGGTYLEGAAHSHEVCGLPLAPGTHVCEVCGAQLPAGVEHSHQEDHHQDHGSNHH